MRPKTIRKNLILFAVIQCVLLFALPSASAQSLQQHSQTDGQESLSNSSPNSIKISVEIPLTLEEDIEASLHSLAAFNSPQLGIRAAYFRPASKKYAYLTKATYLSMFLSATQNGSLSPFNRSNAGGITLATAANVLGLRMARSEKWNKLWWLPQASCIGLTIRAMNVGEANDSSPLGKISGTPSLGDRARRR